MAVADDLRALELRRAGVPIPKIMEQCGFRTRTSCLSAIERAMRAQGAAIDPLALRAGELDRLDRLHFAIWTKALKGDPAAVDRVLSIMQMRIRIAGMAEAGMTPLTSAFDETIDLLRIEGADAALVAIGRRYCEQIDAANGLGDQTAVTKALHLMPHVVNVLRELGATPAARAALKGVGIKPKGADGPGAVVTGLGAFKQQHGLGT